MRGRARLVAAGLLWAQLPGIAWAAEPDRVTDLSPGVDRIVAQMRDREAELRRRERELAERDRAIAELESELVERIAELEQLQSDIEARIEAWTTKDGDRVTQLSKVYAAMPPVRAARLLEDLELDLAVLVLGRMKQKQSAAVMSQMDSKRALLLSRRLVRPLEPSPATARR